jgi:RNA recognition motif-containing protein
MNIYVGNLPREATEDDLKEAFEAFGEVTSAKIIKDKFTGDSRGFGFVEMSNNTEAQAAISGLDGKDLKGSALRVNEARPRRDDRGRGGGGFGRPGGGGGGGRRRF